MMENNRSRAAAASHSALMSVRCPMASQLSPTGPTPESGMDLSEVLQSVAARIQRLCP